MQPGPLLSHVGGHRVPAAPPTDPSGKPLAEQGRNLLAWLYALLLPTRRRTSSPPLQQAGVDTQPACAAGPPAEAQAPTPANAPSAQPIYAGQQATGF